MGEWRKLHNTELHALYSSLDIIRNIKSRRLRWAGHVARMGESRNAYRVLVGRPEGKIPLGRPRRRWEDNIKMDLREVGYDETGLILLRIRINGGLMAKCLVLERKRRKLPQIGVNDCMGVTITWRVNKWQTFLQLPLQEISHPLATPNVCTLSVNREGSKETGNLFKIRRLIVKECMQQVLDDCSSVQSIHTLRMLTQLRSSSQVGVAINSCPVLTPWGSAEDANCYSTFGFMYVADVCPQNFKFVPYRTITKISSFLNHLEAVLERVGEERMILKLIRKKKRNWLGHWLRRNCLVKNALEGMVKGRRVRSRRRYQMIDDIKIYGSYEETKRKAENRKDWRKRSLQ
ncbi:hypothetical protein ANN_06107 [Periplaneta americana]|uniref:Uncharacterized protein n=1 Tax=Periplaneta americana TaxID=6978 RepID=A0ABQ8TF33_PERAM|nr:hypothetical protein ANN_06107 [Periplaneta americana]